MALASVSASSLVYCWLSPLALATTSGQNSSANLEPSAQQPETRKVIVRSDNDKADQTQISPLVELILKSINRRAARGEEPEVEASSQSERSLLQPPGGREENRKLAGRGLRRRQTLSEFLEDNNYDYGDSDASTEDRAADSLQSRQQSAGSGQRKLHQQPSSDWFNQRIRSSGSGKISQKKPVHVNIRPETVNGLMSLLLLFVLAICGCIGTIFVISALTVIETLQTRGNCYLVSVALSHLLVGLCVLPSSAIEIMAGDGLDPLAVCHYQWLLMEFSAKVNSLSFMLLSLDNYLGYRPSERVVTSTTVAPGTQLKQLRAAANNNNSSNHNKPLIWPMPSKDNANCCSTDDGQWRKRMTTLIRRNNLVAGWLLRDHCSVNRAPHDSTSSNNKLLIQNGGYINDRGSQNKLPVYADSKRKVSAGGCFRYRLFCSKWRVLLWIVGIWVVSFLFTLNEHHSKYGPSFCSTSPAPMTLTLLSNGRIGGISMAPSGSWQSSQSTWSIENRNLLQQATNIISRLKEKEKEEAEEFDRENDSNNISTSAHLSPLGVQSALTSSYGHNNLNHRPSAEAIGSDFNLHLKVQRRSRRKVSDEFTGKSFAIEAETEGQSGANSTDSPCHLATKSPANNKQPSGGSGRPRICSPAAPIMFVGYLPADIGHRTKLPHNVVWSQLIRCNSTSSLPSAETEVPSSKGHSPKTELPPEGSLLLLCKLLLSLANDRSQVFKAPFVVHSHKTKQNQVKFRFETSPGSWKRSNETLIGRIKWSRRHSVNYDNYSQFNFSAAPFCCAINVSLARALALDNEPPRGGRDALLAPSLGGPEAIVRQVNERTQVPGGATMNQRAASRGYDNELAPVVLLELKLAKTTGQNSDSCHRNPRKKSPKLETVTNGHDNDNNPFEVSALLLLLCNNADANKSSTDNNCSTWHRPEIEQHSFCETLNLIQSTSYEPLDCSIVTQHSGSSGCENRTSGGQNNISSSGSWGHFLPALLFVQVEEVRRAISDCSKVNCSARDQRVSLLLPLISSRGSCRLKLTRSLIREQQEAAESRANKQFSPPKSNPQQANTKTTSSPSSSIELEAKAKDRWPEPIAKEAEAEAKLLMNIDAIGMMQIGIEKAAKTQSIRSRRRFSRSVGHATSVVLPPAANKEDGGTNSHVELYQSNQNHRPSQRLKKPYQSFSGDSSQRVASAGNNKRSNEPIKPPNGYYWLILSASILAPSLASALLFFAAYLKMKEFKMRPYKPMPTVALNSALSSLLVPQSPLPLPLPVQPPPARGCSFHKTTTAQSEAGGGGHSPGRKPVNIYKPEVGDRETPKKTADQPAAPFALDPPPPKKRKAVGGELLPVPSNAEASRQLASDEQFLPIEGKQLEVEPETERRAVSQPSGPVAAKCQEAAIAAGSSYGGLYPRSSYPHQGPLTIEGLNLLSVAAAPSSASCKSAPLIISSQQPPLPTVSGAGRSAGNSPQPPASPRRQPLGQVMSDPVGYIGELGATSAHYLAPAQAPVISRYGLRSGDLAPMRRLSPVAATRHESRSPPAPVSPLRLYQPDAAASCSAPPSATLGRRLPPAPGTGTGNGSCQFHERDPRGDEYLVRVSTPLGQRVTYPLVDATEQYYTATGNLERQHQVEYSLQQKQQLHLASSMSPRPPNLSDGYLRRRYYTPHAQSFHYGTSSGNYWSSRYPYELPAAINDGNPIGTDRYEPSMDAARRQQQEQQQHLLERHSSLPRSSRLYQPEVEQLAGNRPLSQRLSLQEHSAGGRKLPHLQEQHSSQYQQQEQQHRRRKRPQASIDESGFEGEIQQQLQLVDTTVAPTEGSGTKQGAAGSDQPSLALGKVIKRAEGDDKRDIHWTFGHQSADRKTDEEAAIDQSVCIEAIEELATGNDKQSAAGDDSRRSDNKPLPAINNGPSPNGISDDSNNTTTNKAIVCTYKYMTDDQLLRSNIMVFSLNLSLWCPFLALSISSQYEVYWSPEVRDVVWWLAVLSCCSCSYIYAITNKDFREAFNRLFYYCCCKSHVNYPRKAPVERRQLDVDREGNLRVHIIPGIAGLNSSAFRPQLSVQSSHGGHRAEHSTSAGHLMPSGCLLSSGTSSRLSLPTRSAVIQHPVSEAGRSSQQPVDLVTYVKKTATGQLVVYKNHDVRSGKIHRGPITSGSELL